MAPAHPLPVVAEGSTQRWVGQPRVGINDTRAGYPSEVGSLGGGWASGDTLGVLGKEAAYNLDHPHLGRAE